MVALAVVAATGALMQRFLIVGFARRKRPELFSVRGGWRPKLVKSMAPIALRAVLDAVLLGGEASIDTGLDYESQAFAVCVATEDMREGTRAFLEKRKPAFNGR